MALSSEGFTRKSLQEIINSIKVNVRNDIPNFNTSNDTVINQFIGILALELDESWQAIEGVYSSQTLNGAEGKYLDDVLSRNGVFRSGASQASGDVIVSYNPAQITGGNTIPSTTNMTIDGRVYNIDRQYSLNTFYSSYSIGVSDLAIGVNVQVSAGLLGDTGVGFTYTPISLEDMTNTLERIRDYVRSQIGDQSDKVNVVGDRVLIGYDAAGNATPFLKEELFFTATLGGVTIGQGGKRVTFTSVDSGIITVNPTQVTDISPTFVGYVSSTGFQDFNAGQEAQTDAEYRASFSSSVAAGVQDSLAGLTAAISRIDGVSKVRIYENPTSTDTAIVDANSIKAVVIGGSQQEIALSLFLNTPVNSLFDGDTIVTITNPSTNEAETVRYDIGVRELFQLTLTYSTRDGTDLTETERNRIETNLAAINARVDIGEDVDQQSLLAAVYNGVDFQKITSLSVTNTKTSTGQSSTSDLEVDFNELAVINTPATIYTRTT